MTASQTFKRELAWGQLKKQQLFPSQLRMASLSPPLFKYEVYVLEIELCVPPYFSKKASV